MRTRTVLPASVTSTGHVATDIFEYVRFLLVDRGGGLGMLIMVLCGFAGYMSHIGANTILVKLASKPLAGRIGAVCFPGAYNQSARTKPSPYKHKRPVKRPARTTTLPGIS